MYMSARLCESLFCINIAFILGREYILSRNHSFYLFSSLQSHLTNACTHACTHACMLGCMHMCTQMHVHAQTHACTHMHVHTHEHQPIHTCTHAHTHKFKELFSPFKNSIICYESHAFIRYTVCPQNYLIFSIVSPLQ